MRIKTLTLNNFRAFPGPDSATIKLDGKNLLVYGENGSGKSSVFHSLRAFFSTSTRTVPAVLDHEGGRNQFSGITDCSVSVEFSDGTAALVWNDDYANLGTIRSDTRVVEAALRASFLDYKSLLQTNFSHGRNAINLFEVIVGTVLADYPVTITGGTTKTLLELYADAEWAIPRGPSEEPPEIVWDFAGAYTAKKTHTQAVLNEIERARLEFNKGLRDALTALIPIVNSLLHKLPVDGLVLDGFTFNALVYDRDTRRFSGRHIEPEIKYWTYSPPRPQTFLNEARLSALALALYLAGRHHIVPPDADYTANGLDVPLKLLVLDDVLIGLDMANRGKILQILDEMFDEWQIVLLTHDYVWYEMLRMSTETSKWKVYELYRVFDIDAGFDRPLVKAHGVGWPALLVSAKSHLDNGDARAAAVYARSAFEGWAKNRADRNLKVTYFKDPSKLPMEQIWVAIQESCKGPSGVVPPAKQTLITNLEVARKVVLNPWSHASGAPVIEAEVQAAIDAVRALERL